MSPYFYHVVPPDTAQGQYAAQFAAQVLDAHQVVVLNDSSDSYSSSLSDSFATSFSQVGANYNVVVKNFTLGDASSLDLAVQSAFAQNSPDLIFLAGYSNDLNNLKNELARKQSTIPVMGGDASYKLGDFGSGNYSNFYFTAFTYPDAWDILCPASQSCAGKRPPISDNSEYGKTFDPRDQHSDQYGFARTAPHSLLAYDATTALVLAANSIASQLSTGNTSLEAVRIALQGVSFQGSSGQIAFSGSDPTNKAVFMLCVDSHHHTQLARTYGQFAVGAKDYQVGTDYIKSALCA